MSDKSQADTAVTSLDKPAVASGQHETEAAAAALRLFEAAAPSVVRVVSRGPSGELESLGTGFVVDQKGTIATDFHCVNKSFDLFVQKGDKLYQAEVGTASRGDDLALLKTLSKLPSSAKAIELANPDGLELDDTMYGIGHARGGRDASLSIGKGAEKMTQAEAAARMSDDNAHGPALRAEQRDDFVNAGRDMTRPMLRSRIHLEPGMSGGPLLNADGKAVGILDIGAGDVGYSTHAESIRKLMSRSLQNEFVYSDVASAFGEYWKNEWRGAKASKIVGDVWNMTRSAADVYASKGRATADDGMTYETYAARAYLDSSLRAARGLADWKPQLAHAVQGAASAVALAGIVRMDGLGERISGTAFIHAAAAANAASQFMPQRHVVSGRR